jgi:hypothetical protein
MFKGTVENLLVAYINWNKGTVFVNVTFQVLTMASMKITVFWGIALCRLVEIGSTFQRCLLPPSSSDHGGSKHF